MATSGLRLRSRRLSFGSTVTSWSLMISKPSSSWWSFTRTASSVSVSLKAGCASTRPRCANLGRMLRLLLAVFLTAIALAAQNPVYVVLWFDTEDYIEPAADDAAMRLANDLTSMGVRATFKVVGEKARMLESRGRADVIRALSAHNIGYHSDFHSIQPAPAVYLRRLG